MDSSPAARAASEAAEIGRLRAIAAKQRERAAAYARYKPPADPLLDPNANVRASAKASAEARAASADEVANRLQTMVDFNLAEAAKEGGR